VKVGIAYYAEKNAEFAAIAKGIEKALVEASHQVEIIDLVRSVDTLTKFNYIIIGVNSTAPFGGKIPVGFKSRIKSAGMIGGKHTACFTDKKFGSFKTLQNLMKLLETDGCLICSSEIISSPEFAYHYGKKISIY
jgi:hypothetical protein